VRVLPFSFLMVLNSFEIFEREPIAVAVGSFSFLGLPFW
jgi:hypothetical protein